MLLNMWCCTQHPSLDALPDDVTVNILHQAWAARPRGPASAEVRLACGLQNVCRRFRRLIRQEAPLALDLDFTKAPVSQKQRAWLVRRRGHPGCVTPHSKRACLEMQIMSGNRQPKQDACRLIMHTDMAVRQEQHRAAFVEIKCSVCSHFIQQVSA